MPIAADERRRGLVACASLVALCLLVRLGACALNIQFDSDVNTFKAWSLSLYEHGLSGFYTSGVFADYPPGYMYVLWVLGALCRTLGLSPYSGAFTLLIKLPAMLCDAAAVVILYAAAEKRVKPRLAWLLAAAYALNPAVVLDSAVWGQVDSVHTLILLASVYFMAEKRYTPGYLLFAAAILVKPQALILSPIYLYAAYAILTDGRFKPVSFAKVALLALGCAFVLLAGILPFTRGFNLSPIVERYAGTLASYPYASVNAFNFHALVGGNYTDLGEAFLGVSFQTWGVLAIDAIIILSLVLLDRNFGKANVFFSAALLNTLAFVFSVKMHERYLFTSLVFLLLAFIYTRNKRLLALYAGFSATFFINCAAVLYMARNGYAASLLEPYMAPVSLVNVLLALFMLHAAFAAFPRENGFKERRLPILAEAEPEEPEPAFTGMAGKDWVLCGLIILIYANVAFYSLGNTASPQTTWEPLSKTPVIADFGEVRRVSHAMYMQGGIHGQSFELYTSADSANWVSQYTEEANDVFAWKMLPLDYEARYVIIVPLSNALSLQEMVFRDENGGLIPPTALYEGFPEGWTGIGAAVSPPVPVTETGRKLFDEQELAPERPDYMNSTYFDEIYHPRTAYEYIHKQQVYENTHPPLGKVIISWGISMFGMTPFGWRFMGALTGALMLLPLYVLARRMFGATKWAVLATLLFAADFMHFTQTRIGTIDTYIVFFAICAACAMYVYMDRNLASAPFKKALVPLGLSGLFMGLAIATKWTGVYTGAGLALLFAYAWAGEAWRQRAKTAAAVALPEAVGDLEAVSDTEVVGETEAVTHAGTETDIKQRFIKTACWCTLFFVAVPLVIYTLSYIPFMQTPGQQGVRSILLNQRSMLDYHWNLTTTHPYESLWWQWPFDTRPVFYYARTLENGLRQGISAFGNPAVWWLGLVGFVYCAYRAFCRADRRAAFLVIMYLAQLLPWALISRTAFIYHYFPNVPFIVLMAVYFLKRAVAPGGMKFVYAYAALAVLLFALFYPVLGGMPVSEGYVEYLKWLPGWQLI